MRMDCLEWGLLRNSASLFEAEARAGDVAALIESDR
jgi:hypothetical protein